ncbi:MAG: sulfhydrogenase subunit delta [Gammaproteobacteria bacterium]|nr:sulfhydrogenase subunit delta [Gammaproteobacteria bacterium]
MDAKPRLAVHKFSSCDGCQLAFLNQGAELLQLATLVEIVHFAQAGFVAPDATVDMAFVEGSISTPEDEKRIRLVRKNSRYLVAIGACATAGGLQALRNRAPGGAGWIAEIYPQPGHIHALPASTAVSAHVPVDAELWGCPVNGRQVLDAVRGRLFGVTPVVETDKVCLECKRQQGVCVLVAHGAPCMGPVTRTGCGALCPRLHRDCYACYGPAENANTQALGRRLADLGLSPAAIARRFLSINNAATAFRDAGDRWQEEDHGDA